MNRIPKILHYCFGFESDFGGKPWSLVHHACVASAIQMIKPEQVYFHYEYEPVGPWWNLTQKLVTPVKVDAPRSIFGNKLSHPAHRADVVRLELLIERGGIYLDADVLVHRDFDDLLGNSVVLGTEGRGDDPGLANAVILAEAGASFLRRWHAEYNWFRSKGADDYWSEHSVRVPMTLARAFPTEVTVLPFDAFYWPLFTEEGIKAIFGETDGNVKSTYANHLWESRAWTRHLEHLTPGAVRRTQSQFCNWTKPFIADLPDDYGAATFEQRLRRFGRRALGKAKRQLR